MNKMTGKIRISRFIALCALLAGAGTISSVKAQDFDEDDEAVYMTGLLPDDGTSDLLPHKADLMTRDYTVLPSSYSLMKYTPEAKSQSRYGTCTSWATVYAARTIAEAVKYGWTDKARITSEAFSPIFIYAQIKNQGDYDCQKGSQIYRALDVLKEKGVPKFSVFSDLCATNLASSLFTAAAPYRIDDYTTLFSVSFRDGEQKIKKVKKSLSENCPVVIAMWLPDSFMRNNGSWGGEDTDVDKSKHGYHAMCVVGYDDNRNGGSFQIMNSWGKNWGNNGFVWVKYDDFARFVDQAYEMYVAKYVKPEPKPQPKPEPVKYDFAGDIELELSTGEKMQPQLQQGSAIPVYKLREPYMSRTRYRVYISNNEPAYVYVIGSDNLNNVSKVFPPADNISAALTYKSNHIAIPDEKYYIELDDNVGSDYMCVLYSKNELPVNDIVKKIKNASGSFQDKVKSAVSGLVPKFDITNKSNAISFSARSEKTVVPVIVEIPHK